MKTTGGHWDPLEPPIYFLAADMGSVGLAATRLCIEACLEHGFRLSIQTHKYLEID